jgi:hypothetical protein
MILLVFFLIGVTLAFSLFPDWSLATTLLVPLGAVLALRLALFLTSRPKK